MPRILDLFVILGLAGDLVVPLPIAMGWLPSEFRWLSLLALVSLAALAYVRLMTAQSIPKATWFIVGLSVLGTVVALLGNQGSAPTIWGWWLMFRYPLVGLCVYLRRDWSASFTRRMLQIGIGILVLEVIVQATQYMSGVRPGDWLSGTFGSKGTSALVLVILFVLAQSLGAWIAQGELRTSILVLGLGVVSSTLGEMKVFLVAATAMSVLAAFMYLLRKRRILQLFPIAAVLLVAVLGFSVVFNSIVPGARSRPLESYFDPTSAEQYLSTVRIVEGGYDVGRNAMLNYVWHRLSLESFGQLVGEGLGAQGESVVLGTAGSGLLTSHFGLVVTSSLVVILGELGLVGLVAVTAFGFWVILACWRGTSKRGTSDFDGLLYGLILYTAMWPLFMWYTTAWTLPVVNLLYWSCLGYAVRGLRETARHSSPLSRLT